jgi:uncharacterized protein with NAD-binding domain and iron-sulfur cluster
MTSSDASTRLRVAVLGGGAGALSAAFALTHPDNPHASRYELTVFQLGWRLGGKGASGRNQEHADRIEEHGLHVWMGFYENAFAVMRQAYDEWKGADNIFGTWRNAFTPQSFVPYQEFVRGEWRTWPVTYPTNSALPGEGGELPSLWNYVEMLLDALCTVVTHHHIVTIPTDPDEHAHWFSSLVHAAEHAVEHELDLLGEHLLHHALAFVRALGNDIDRHPDTAHARLITLLERFLAWLWHRIGSEIDRNDDLRRTWLLVDLGVANLRGAIAEDVFRSGFTVIDRYDYREFLRIHGAAEATLSSVPIRALYDLFFAFEQGDIERPNLAAGVALRALVRMVFTYKGAIFWKMNAGMGDTIFTPLYRTLVQRGVQFAFFHRVTRLDDDGHGAIGSIHLKRQVRLREGIDHYQPCISVHGLPCWPSEPLYDQLDPMQADILRKQQIDLESFWTPWQDMGEEEDVILRLHEDYDLVILGIPPTALAHIMPPDVLTREPWQRMLAEVTTVQTQALQLWVSKDLKDMGWEAPSPITTAYAEPMDTWCDMTHLLPRENWPADDAPKNISYFCGPMRDADHIPPAGAHDFPAEEAARVRQTAVDWIDAEMAHFLPKAAPVGNPAGFDWNLLTAPGSPATGEARLATQFWRANCDPTQRYTLSRAGSIRHRLKTDGSGFSNLYLAGDWIDCILNVGCVEATVISGLLCSRAMSGYPTTIIGEDDHD